MPQEVTSEDDRFTAKEHAEIDHFNEKFMAVLERTIPRLAATLADGPINQVDMDDLAFLRDAYARIKAARRVHAEKPAPQSRIVMKAIEIRDGETPLDALRRTMRGAVEGTADEDKVDEAFKMLEASGVDGQALRSSLDAIKLVADRHGVSPSRLMQQFATDYSRRLARAGIDPIATQRQLGKFMEDGNPEGMARLRMETVEKLTAYEKEHGKGDMT